jgi:hypothetical protein
MADMIKAALTIAAVTCAAAFPAAALLTDLTAAKAAVVAGATAGYAVLISALIAEAYELLAPLWGRLGNLLQDWKNR